MSTLDEVVAAADPAVAGHALPAPGPDRFAEAIADPDRRFTLEAVLEGYLLHHAEPRAFGGMDPDLALLAGDALYALGLRRLADRGDLEAVAVLCDLITGTARAQAEGDPAAAEALWEAAASRLG